MKTFKYFTNLVFYILHSKIYLRFGFFLFLLGPLSLSSQQRNDSIPRDSLAKSKEPLLLSKVRYNAKDTVRIKRKENKLYLINEAEMYYQDIELKAGIIVLDYTKNEVYAGRIPDSSGVLSQYPFFKQANNEVNPDSIRFNFDTQKALIWNSKTAENGMNIKADLTKKQNDSVYYIKDAKVTTGGDLDKKTDYYFRVRKGKIIPKGKIITGFTNMYIAEIPTPIALPFAYFPSSQKQESGFLFPTIGESNNRGYYLQNGGYYLALSDYFDLALMGDYYTNGSYGFRGDSKYAVRYKFRGTFSFRFENLINSERGLPDYSKSSVFNVRWSHSKDSKSSPNSSFSASVNFGSSDYFQQSVNQLNSPNFLNNNLSSSVSYSKTFPAYPRVNVSLTTTMSQNSKTKSVNLTLPTFQANMERIFPFAPKTGSKKGIIQNINFQYTARAENRIITTEDDLFTSKMFDEARSGMKHTIPISTNFKVLKYLSVTASGNYEEVWAPKVIRYNDYDEASGTAVKDTISEFNAFRQYNFGLSVGTTLYGMFNFGDDKKIQSIRHTIRPSLSYSSRPSFDQYYDTYIIDADGNTAEYTRFENSLFGSPSKSYSRSIGLSVTNNFEAKVRDKDSTATEAKKIVLLNNLNFSTSYNLAADSLRLSPIRMTTGINLFKKKLSINLGATFDPYALDDDNRRFNTLNIKNGGSLVRMTSANMNMNYSFSNKDFEGEDDDDDDRSSRDTSSSGGRDDDLFGRANDYSVNSMEQEDDTPAAKYPSYRTKIPWDLKFAYSLTYNNATQQRNISNNSLMFSGNIELTPKWKVGMSSGYDFKGKGVTYTQLRFDRDLDSWKLNFSWVPFSQRASWNFFIGIKSGLLSDIKYDKVREPDRRL